MIHLTDLMQNPTEAEIKLLNGIIKNYQFGATDGEMIIDDVDNDLKNCVERFNMWGLFKSYQIRVVDVEREPGDDRVEYAYHLKGVNWKNVFEVANWFFNNQNCIPKKFYKIEQQKNILTRALLEAKSRADSDKFIFTEKDLFKVAQDDYQAVSLSEAIQAISDDGFIKILNVSLRLFLDYDISSKLHCYEYSVELLKPLSKNKNPYEKVKVPKPADYHTGMQIYISGNKGIWRIGDLGELKYPISRKRMVLVKSLENGFLTGPLLIAILKTRYTVVTTAVNEINRHFQEKLNLHYKLIEKVPTGGYRLNYDRYDIKFTQDD